ncbi:hypothetical protein KIN20_034863 [Parelaphostrongylus tenuis]|uniref:Uncharacterized protein n=1 Tax=Parelaphostrongylus tenuis TaxID=148309 RepID=A0AAD5RAB6_PARTN|nr:hypothetical protein KIN20_034863 [Parelaphostrongylus tenuis]
MEIIIIIIMDESLFGQQGWNHLQQFDFVHKTPHQDPHKSTKAQASCRVEVWGQLLQNPLNDRF